ncbi:site-specific DNA-methyltransferase [Megasphaera coli]|uniref:site-specific DNA-methyltransferase n=1 Tax=Colibacter massiliensis TaxID=1852379 RepID=UPI00094EE3F9|nr:site-specific DNA-methyltransferase [Colibacter massiliensis]
MEKMRMESVDGTAQNIEKIEALFPNCITETKDEAGTPKKTVKFDLLKQMLLPDVIEGDEAYEFTWVGKKAAIVEANKPIRKTLRPCKEESVNWDTTENLYIEGKNTDVLKLLSESYLGKVKLIYIDPPYNTGNNIIYPNDYSLRLEEYEELSGHYDDDGNVLVKNTNSNGRFHSDWCSLMYKVLLVARNILRKDGYIALAIDDNELYTLKLICDEVFGEQNYIGTIVTRCNPQGRNRNNIDPVHEYHLVYANDIFAMPLFRIKKKSEQSGYGYLIRSGTNSRKFERPSRFYPILVKDGIISMITKDEYNKIYAKNREFDEAFIKELKNRYEHEGYTFILPISKNGEEKVWQRTFDRVLGEYQTYIYEAGQIKIPMENTRTPISLWSEDIYSNVSNGTNRIKALFDNEVLFDFSKSLFTVKDFISLNTSEDDVILDFFSGSATTAHATMLLNSEDNAKRKFIMVQIPEPCKEDTPAYKAGYKTICEIGKERIRRAGKMILEESGANIDVGFRVLKVDDTNMKDVYYSAVEYDQMKLPNLESNIKEDRTDLDLLFGCLLEWGLPLSLPYTSEEIDGCTIHNYNDGDLIACFNENIPDSVVKAIAGCKPLRAVFRDSSFADSPAKINVTEIFKLMAPDASVKVI